jgi:hypothetical protein
MTTDGPSRKDWRDVLHRCISLLAASAKVIPELDGKFNVNVFLPQMFQ